MQYLVELRKNTLTNNVKQEKEFETIQKATSYISECLSQLQPEDIGYISLKEVHIEYEFLSPHAYDRFSFEKDNLTIYKDRLFDWALKYNKVHLKINKIINEVHKITF